MDLEKRIRIAKKESQGRNCLGTAFFLSSVFSEDGCYDTKSAYYEVLRYLVQLRKPKTGSIIVLHKVSKTTGFNEAMHAGVITSLNPVKIAHRLGFSGRLLEDDDLYRFRIYLRYQNHQNDGFRNSLRYYSPIPRGLAQLL